MPNWFQSLFNRQPARPAEDNLKAHWQAVDAYFNSRLLPADPALEHALQVSDAAGLPPIHVAPNQGKLLMLLAQSVGATRILEIGALGGYSTIWLARALPPGGRLITLEVDPKHAAVARENLAGAGLAEMVEIHLGQALDSLARLAGGDYPPFDFIFIDADKGNYPQYFEWALRLSRTGALIFADNVTRKGKVIDEHSRDADVLGMRAFFERVAAEPRVSATALQTVGSKGYDGFALLRVNQGTQTGGIHHLALWARDLEGLKTFYQTYFGAAAGERYANPRTGFQSYFLRFASGAQIELMHRPDVQPDRNEPGSNTFGYAHLSISVGSEAKVDELTARLQSAGFTVLSQPRRTGDGYYESLVLDPENNPLEITV